MAKSTKSTKDDMLQQIAEMTVLELSELVSAIEEKFNVSATPVIPAQTMEVAVETEKEVEQTEFKVVLHDFGVKKIMVIKALRTLTDLSLMDSKKVIEAGGALREGMSKDEANKFAETLAAAGANVEVQ